MAGSIDPYKILGVSHDASLDEIRQAYRRAATKYHPDAGGDAWAFQQVQQAYDQLRSQFENRPYPQSNQSNSSVKTEESTTFSATYSSESAQEFSFDAKKNPGKPGNPVEESKTPSANWQDWLFGKPLRLHNETSYFILANFMDLVMTGILLGYSAVEANPIANFFYLRFGYFGMIGLKVASVTLVCLVAQSIASRSELKAKLLLVGGTVLVALVVVYSIFLARHQLMQL